MCRCGRGGLRGVWAAGGAQNIAMARVARVVALALVVALLAAAGTATAARVLPPEDCVAKCMAACNAGDGVGVGVADGILPGPSPAKLTIVCYLDGPVRSCTLVT